MKWLGNLLLVFVSTLVVLVLGEVILRAGRVPIAERLKTHQSAGRDIDEVHPRGLYTIHKSIGWTLSPHFDGRFIQSDFDISVRANSLGIREREPMPGGEDAFRILGLGDSFAFGWGVAYEESLIKLLESELNREEGATKYETVNAGIPGFGAYEAFQMLKTIGMSYRPDLVLLVFYEGNDYRNTGDAPRTRMIDDGYLRDIPGRKPPALVSFLTRHSLLASLVKTKIDNVYLKRRFQDDVKKTKQYLRKMKQFLDQRKIPFVFVLIPDQEAAFYNRPAFLKAYDRWHAGMDLFEARAALKTFCAENGIAFYQLSRKFEDDPGAPAMRLEDTHLNPAGHRLAAQEIGDFLLNSELA